MRRFFAFVTSSLVTLAVLPAAAEAGGGGGCVEPPTDGRSTTVELSSFCFTPTVTRVEVGATVTFVNRDEVDHVVASASDTWGKAGASYRLLRPGRTRVFTFDGEGVFPYACYFHPTMVGAVVVGDGGIARSHDVISPTAVAPVSPPEPLIFHIPKTVTAAAGSSPARTAGLVWGGAALGLLGGLIVAWGTRRRSS